MYVFDIANSLAYQINFFLLIFLDLGALSSSSLIMDEC